MSDAVELLRHLITNKCVNEGTKESGHEYKSVETLQGYLGDKGEVFEPAPGRQSVLFRVPGRRNGAARLMLMGHLDVVPANPEGWKRDPFGGEVKDGFVWGRGAVDMLNVTAASAVVFAEYLRGTRPPLSGDLLFLAVADEEHGGDYGASWLVQNHWDAVGCEYQLTEIAYPAISTASGPAYPINVAEKGPQWRRLSTTGVPGHASQPYGTDNALVMLTAALARLEASPAPAAITPEWQDFVESLEFPEKTRIALLDPTRIDEVIEELAEDSLSFARYVHACTHMTVAPTVLAAGSKPNVIPDEASAVVDVRVLPGQDPDDVDDHISKSAGAGVHIERVLAQPATASRPAGPLWAALEDSYGRLTGSTRVVPTVTPASTDARFFRERGTVCYGAGLFDDRIEFADFLSMFHGNDERISTDSVDSTVEFLAGAVESFGRRT